MRTDRAGTLLVVTLLAGCYDFTPLAQLFVPDQAQPVDLAEAPADLTPSDLACNPRRLCKSKNCGLVPDGCGGMVSCGGCPGTCVDHVCQCPGGRVRMDRLGIDVDAGPEGVYHCYTRDNSTNGQPYPFPCESFLSVERSPDFYIYRRSTPLPPENGLVPLFSCTTDNFRHFLSTQPTCADVGNARPESFHGWMATSPICGARPLTRLVDTADYDRLVVTDPADLQAALAPPDGSHPYVSEGVIGYVWSTAD